MFLPLRPAPLLLRRAASAALSSSGPALPAAVRIEAGVVSATAPLPPIGPGRGFAEVLLTHAERHARADARRVAILDAGAEAPSPPLTYGDLSHRVGAAARGLRALGVSRGGVVALHLPNSPEFAVAFIAASALGATVTTSNPAYTVPELTHQLRDSGAAVLVTTPALAAVAGAAAAAAGLPARAQLVLGAPAARFLSEGDGARRGPEIEDVGDLKTALLVLPYSSGTTGLPKGVRLSHANILANIEQCGCHLGLRPTDSIMGVLPFYRTFEGPAAQRHSYIYGMTTIMAAGLQFGTTVVSLPKFDPGSFLEAAARHRVTFMGLVPPIVAFLAKHPLVDKYDLAAVRTVFSGAAPLSLDLQLAVEQRLKGAVCRQGFGMTELSPVSHIASPALPSKPGSVGPPVPGTACRIVDVDAAEGGGAPRLLPAGAANVGELQVRGPQVMLGYHNNARATAETLTSDGWLRTGDLAYFDADGDFFVVDRLKELIKVKGLQCAPAELEGVLLSHPLIYDAAVVGRADERAGEVPVAFIVSRASMLRAMGRAKDADALPQLTSEAVRDFVATKVADYKRLAAVAFVESIPKAASGKILRRVLRDRVRAELAATAAPQQQKAAT